MRSSAVALALDDEHPALETFTRELSDLCRKHGLGLGDAVVFEMASDDYRFNFRVDDESRLILG